MATVTCRCHCVLLQVYLRVHILLHKTVTGI